MRFIAKKRELIYGLRPATASTESHLQRHCQLQSATMGLGYSTPSTVPEPWPPCFANGLDSPQYTVVGKYEDYEVREYSASGWVSTDQEGMELDKSSKGMFWKLFKFIDKGNSAEEKIAMTCPVLMKITPGQGPACESAFTMSFYVPPREGELPQPVDETVYHSQLPPMKVYIRSFAGFASSSVRVREAEALSKALPMGADYETDYWIYAGYDSPFKLFNRHNEIWFIAK